MEGHALRILFCSYVFSPSVGGIETVSKILAEEFSRQGAAVTVVTDTPGTQDSALYSVVRRPSFGKFRELARQTDIVFQNNISLRTILPALISGKPVVVTHQTWLERAEGGRGWQDYFKRSLLRFCRNVAISEAVASALPVRSVVIGNPFEPGEFADFGESHGTRDIVFMGRLVSSKGCDLVLRALGILKSEGILPSLSIIGDGPEMPALKRRTAELDLSAQVEFRGVLREGRGREVARHKIMVVPSTWEEPFGVVALEGIAAGCVVVASRSGGLPEAVGPCGVLFANGDVEGLAAALKELLNAPMLRDEFTRLSGTHLRRFQPEIVARAYMDIFDTALRGS
jgi:glycosyltransferase involved in cell wall biosynthesis